MSGPIDHVGWASACSGVTSSSSSRLRPRNGPPLAVTTRRRSSPRSPPRRHCASAECSESTATIWPGLGPLLDQRAADDQRLLVGEREGASRVEGRERRGQARRAVDPVEHDVARPRRHLGDRARPGEELGQAVVAGGVAALLRLGVERELEVLGGRSLGDSDHIGPQVEDLSGQQVDPPSPAASPATRNRSGLRRITSMACVPMEPVEPRITTSLGPDGVGFASRSHLSILTAEAKRREIKAQITRSRTRFYSK